MNTLDIESLKGVDANYQPIIYDAMKTSSNAQRLCVCLYLMSDLPDYMHSLDNIEKNLAQIFPPSIPHGNTPDTYKDFAATAIRQYFNYETSAVRDYEITAEDRLWQNPQRGHWRNTHLGNSYALRVLQERGIAIRRHGRLQDNGKSTVDYSARRYLDEHTASERLRIRHEESTADQEDDSRNRCEALNNAPLQNKEDVESRSESTLLNNISEMLKVLSQASAPQRKLTDDKLLRLVGSPSMLLQLLTSHQASSMEVIEFHFQQMSGTWKVELIVTDEAIVKTKPQ